tara:strand:- start:2073 stop:2387 length:315 start_codon:yes stop_codon:yes gene_type:complete
MKKTNLETGDKLMLLQGIDLIENGLRFLDWMNKSKNETTADSLMILKDRFRFFKENALNDYNFDLFIISKAKNSIGNIQNNHKQKCKVRKELERLKTEILNKRF